MAYSSNVKIVVCGPNIASINSGAFTTPKIVTVYDVSALPVNSADYFTFTAFTTTNTHCPITSVTIDNSNLHLSGTSVWRVNPTVI